HLYISPTRRAEFFALLGAGDRVTDFESEVRRPDGTALWIRENVRAARDATGRVVRLQGFVSDVTARKRTEANLQASEQRSRAIFEHSPFALIEFDYRGMKEWLDGLRAQGVTDLDAHFNAHPEALAATLAKTRFTALNDATVRLVGARSKEEVL